MSWNRSARLKVLNAKSGTRESSSEVEAMPEVQVEIVRAVRSPRSKKSKSKSKPRRKRNGR